MNCDDHGTPHDWGANHYVDSKRYWFRRCRRCGYVDRWRTKQGDHVSAPDRARETSIED